MWLQLSFMDNICTILCELCSFPLLRYKSHIGWFIIKHCSFPLLRYKSYIGWFIIKHSTYYCLCERNQWYLVLHAHCMHHCYDFVCVGRMIQIRISCSPSLQLQDNGHQCWFLEFWISFINMNFTIYYGILCSSISFGVFFFDFHVIDKVSSQLSKL